MLNNSREIAYPRNHNITIQVIEGHFVTSHSHINYYVDITAMKHRQRMARDVAAIMADEFGMGTEVDAIVCLDGSEVIGAFLARELARTSLAHVNSGKDICVVTPEFNANGQMMFRDNIQPMVKGKKILLLIASITTGKTLHRCLECMDYYGARVTGVAAVFSAIPEREGRKIFSLFTPADIPGYSTYSFRDCPKCLAGEPVDALANSYGYSLV